MEINKNKKVHFLPPYLSRPSHPITITVIGCGGTGSMLIPRLARLNCALQELGHPGIYVKVIDGDRVEAHNPFKQQFLFSDLGKYKASCLIERINFAFGLDWEAQNIFLEEKDFSLELNSNIIITCVDNAKLRMQLHSYYQKVKKQNKHIDFSTPLYWLDCGNGKDFGQLILSTVQKITQPKTDKYNCTEELKSVVDLYGNIELLDNKEIQGIESCSLKESLEEQDMFINDEMALSCVKFVRGMFNKLFLEFQGQIINQKRNKSLPLKIN